MSLTLARTIAARLPNHPEWIELARGNLIRWMHRHGGAAESPATYHEWLAILEKPLDQVMAIYTQQSDEGQRLRQNSPFAGVLSAREVWSIKEQCRRETR